MIGNSKRLRLWLLRSRPHVIRQGWRTMGTQEPFTSLIFSERMRMILTEMKMIKMMMFSPFFEFKYKLMVISAPFYKIIQF